MRTMAEMQADLREIGRAVASYPTTDRRMRAADQARAIAAILMRALKLACMDGRSTADDEAHGQARCTHYIAQAQAEDPEPCRREDAE